MRANALAAAALLAIAGAANAQTAGNGGLAETNVAKAQKWGLIGSWAPECNAPPSRSNGYLTYVVSGSEVIHQREFGDARDSNNVMGIRLLTDGIEITTNFQSLNPPQTRTYEYVRDGNRWHAKYNYNVADNTYTIRDFTIVSNGQPAVWAYKCK